MTLELQAIDQRWGDTRALDSVSLSVGPGEILGVTGPSGAGKSTLCRIVAGVQAPTRGEVRIDGRGVTHVPPERRGVAMMFESYALYPHLSVFDNVAFPLRAPGAPLLSREIMGELVRELLRFVELDHLEHRRPAELSGGQRQRVALSRALVQDARVYVLDEPISHLDAKLRHTLRGAIRRRLVRGSAPTIWTSPDAAEVLAVADRVAVLVAGRVRQVGAPAEIYRRPAHLEVARLVGDPPLNLLEGALAAGDRGLVFQHPALTLPLPDDLGRRLGAEPATRRVVLGLRPAELRVGASATSVPARVWVWEPLGRYGILSVRLGDDVVRLKVERGRSFQPGEVVRLELGGVEPLLFDATHGGAL
ncbi:MAG TPA: ABC transporter ATP-binding protein [Methylomirabilota bacterium]|nr:ABC transporter ATP-binding protein [Methylomirabilota bacterium]